MRLSTLGDFEKHRSKQISATVAGSRNPLLDSCPQGFVHSSDCPFDLADSLCASRYLGYHLAFHLGVVDSMLDLAEVELVRSGPNGLRLAVLQEVYLPLVGPW